MRKEKVQASLRVRIVSSETLAVAKVSGGQGELQPNITKTYLKPHFYRVKLGFTGVYIIFLISAQKHRLWVLFRTASARRF